MAQLARAIRSIPQRLPACCGAGVSRRVQRATVTLVTAPRHNVRAFSTEEGGKFSPEQIEQVKKVQESLQAKIVKDTEELKATYGDQFPDKASGGQLGWHVM